MPTACHIKKTGFSSEGLLHIDLMPITLGFFIITRWVRQSSHAISDDRAAASVARPLLALRGAGAH